MRGKCFPMPRTATSMPTGRPRARTRTARRRNREDARFVIRVRMVDIADAREMFPDAEDSDLDADWAAEGEDQDGKIDREAARYYEGTSTPSKIERAGKVRLVE